MKRSLKILSHGMDNLFESGNRVFIERGPRNGVLFARTKGGTICAETVRKLIREGLIDEAGNVTEDGKNVVLDALRG